MQWEAEFRNTSGVVEDERLEDADDKYNYHHKHDCTRDHLEFELQYGHLDEESFSMAREGDTLGMFPSK